MKNICIVGCGAIARMYVKRLRGLARLRFYSRSRDSSERLNKQANGAGVFDSYADALSASDAVIICSPPEFHSAQVIEALEAGKHVLVEKPLCTRPEEIGEIESAARLHPQCILMIGENYYYKPSLYKARELVDSGHIGKIKSILIRRMFTNEVTDWRKSYGALMEGGIHYVALISALLDDEEPLRVSAEYPSPVLRPERSCKLTLDYAEGKRAELHYSWNTKAFPHGFFQTSRIEGETGSITFESNGLWVRVDSPSLRRMFFPNLGDFLGQKKMVEDFLYALRNGSPPYSDLRRAKRDLSIIFQAYEQLPTSSSL